MQRARRTPQWLFTFLAALFAVAVAAPPTWAETDVTARCQVIWTSLLYDRATGTSYLDVSLKNTSTVPLIFPAQLVIPTVSPATITVSNADGTTADGKPYLQLTRPSNQLNPGETTAVKRLRFRNPSAARFSYTTAVRATLPEATGQVGPAGGTVTVANPASPLRGVTVQVPPGALRTSTPITVSAAPNPPLFQNQAAGIGRAMELGPDGTVFDVPVSITFTYDPAELEAQGILDSSTLRAYTYDSGLGAWHPIETQAIVGNTVVATTTHFTTFALTGDRLDRPWPLCPEGQIPCTTDSVHPPVLFVHGVQPFGDPYGNWYGTFRNGPGLLAGANVDVYHLSYDSSKDIRDTAASLALAVRRIKAETGKPVVNVIAHSMGGLVTRAYLQDIARSRFVTDPVFAAQFEYKQDIGKVMMRGTPNHGSVFGAVHGLRWESYRQMLPGSDFLSALNERLPLPETVVLDVAYGAGIPTFTCDANRMDWCLAMALVGVNPWSIVDGDGVVPATSAVLGPEFGAEDIRRLETRPAMGSHAHTPLPPLYPLAVAQVEDPLALVGQQMLSFALDRDVDGIADAEEACPDTIWPERTDAQGCSFEQQRPTLASPAPDAVGVNPDDVKLTWLPMQHPDIGSRPVAYCLVLNEDAEPTDRVVYDGCALGHFWEDPAYGTSLDPNKRYWWAVWAKDARGKWARASGWQAFRTGYKTTLLTSLESLGGGGYVVNLRVDGSDITNITVREPIAGVQQVDDQTFVLTLNGRPNAGDPYTIDITHADGSRETHTWTVPAVNDNFPTITDPIDGGTVTTATPTFTWLEAASTSQYTVKAVEVTATGETPVWITEYWALGAVQPRSVVFNHDGTAAAPLVQGKTYRLYVKGTGASGSLATDIADFTLSLLDQPDYTDPLTGMEFVYVPPGTFQMGDTFGVGWSGERPVHTVTLTRGYYIGTTEVTQAQWQAVMGSNPSYFQPSSGYPTCPTCPVEQVSWNDIQVFLATLNAQTGRSYRLPTEAEWEYAAKGGPYTQGYRYAGSNNVDEVGWHWDNWGSDRWYSGQTATHTVGAKLPNELGLYDMSGNVWEWVQDWWSYYSAGAQTDPAGPATGSYRVIRGGSWTSSAFSARVSSRNISWPDFRFLCFGFRLALSQ